MSTLSDHHVPFIGIGPGRCGTTSLAKILDACEGVRCTHEHVSAPWYNTSDSCIGDLIRDMREHQRNGIIRGDINQSLGRHVSSLRSSFRNLRVVCINRNKEDCVASWLRHNGSMLRPDDKHSFVDKHWQEGPRKVVRCFPTIDGYTKRQAYETYWEFYNCIMDAVAPPVFRMTMEDLNDDTVLVKVMDFLEIPETGRIIPDKRVWNTRDELDTKFKERVRAYPQ